jgi:hypothetical protein
MYTEITPQNNPEGFELKIKIASLKEKLLEKHPLMPNLLKDIHQTLRQYPENVSTLSEEEIQVIVNGLKVQTQTEFATSTTTKKSQPSLTAKIKSLGAGAF